MNRTFTNFYKNRFNWAFSAKNEFINRFVRLDLQQVNISSSKELTISVYGPTQVGKTTIILSLLGLKKEKVNQLSKWLRGKRNLGESSTITVMRYKKSHDNYFNLRLPNGNEKTNLSGDQLEAALQLLRSTIETQSTYSVEPVVVEIPSIYFEASDVNMNIVDLPGVESADIKEVEHVKQCIKHWVPLSEVCLLVDDATQLTAFSQFSLNEIKYWFNQLENFRIIPTRALSLDSIRKSIINDEIISAKDLIADYENVLNRSLNMNLDLSNTIYPIDIGSSWESLCQRDPDLYKKMNTIMQEILQKLKEDLINLDVNELSFNRLTQLYRQAEEASKLELSEIESEIGKLEKLIDRLTFQSDQELKEFKLNHMKFLMEIKKYNDFSSDLTNKFNKLKSFGIENFVKNKIKRNLNNKKASILNSDASKLQLFIEKDLEKQLTEIKERVQNLELLSIYHIELPEINSLSLLKNKIDGFWFRGTYEKALSNLRTDLSFWIKGMYDSFIELLTPILDEVSEKQEHAIVKLESLELLNDKNEKKLQNNISRLLDKKNQLISQHDEVYRLWEQDCDHAKKLQAYFIKHWLQYKDELQYHFIYGNVEDRWLASQYLQLLKLDGKKIIESLNIRGE